jgi:hypothetical protein
VIVNYNHTVITIVHYNRKTFMVQATGLGGSGDATPNRIALKCCQTTQGAKASTLTRAIRWLSLSPLFSPTTANVNEPLSAFVLGVCDEELKKSYLIQTLCWKSEKNCHPEPE